VSFYRFVAVSQPLPWTSLTVCREVFFSVRLSHSLPCALLLPCVPTINVVRRFFAVCSAARGIAFYAVRRRTAKVRRTGATDFPVVRLQQAIRPLIHIFWFIILSGEISLSSSAVANDAETSMDAGNILRAHRRRGGPDEF
jgi:hypothetical protein